MDHMIFFIITTALGLLGTIISERIGLNKNLKPNSIQEYLVTFFKGGFEAVRVEYKAEGLIEHALQAVAPAAESIVANLLSKKETEPELEVEVIQRATQRQPLNISQEREPPEPFNDPDFHKGD